MDEGLKRRLVGASVLAALAAIFVPMLIDDTPITPGSIPDVPINPAVPDFASQVLRDEQISRIPRMDAPSAPVVEPDDIPEPSAPSILSAPTAISAPAPVASSRETSAMPKAWIVQVGSFASRDNAMRLITSLRQAGLDTPDPEAVTMDGQRLYRVRVGPLIERARAEVLVPKIAALTGLQGRVVEYP